MRCLLKLVCSTDIIDLMLSVMYAIWLINEKLGKWRGELTRKWENGEGVGN
jgi:hypothetical protein